MAEPSPVALSDAVFTIFVQICGAFAQGAGGLFVADAVILRAREDYTGAIERDLEHWPREGPFVLALTRTMGQMAAHLALADKQVTIAVKHYESARRAVHVGRFGCPFFERRPK